MASYGRPGGLEIVPPAISILIQAHPRRHAVAEALLERLGEHARIVWDPEPDGRPSPWRTYRRCIETAPADATHLLVIQDDAVVCDGFRDAVEAAVAARPDRLIVLCVTGQGSHHRVAVQTACQRGESWAELPRGQWVSAICNCWPVGLARDLVSWVDEQSYPLSFAADDEIIGRWSRAAGVVPLATVPSLADHPDVEPSIVSRRSRRALRRAAIFVDEHCDERASEIDWTAATPS